MPSRTLARTLSAMSRGSACVSAVLAAAALSPASLGQGTQIVNPSVDAGSPNGATWVDLGGGSWQFTLDGQSVILNFDQFGIPAGAEVGFGFDGGLFWVLNRIAGDFPSIINGTLTAPGGYVFLVNPAGVTIGNGALLNVGSLYAAAGSMSNDAFLTAVGGGDVSFTGLAGTIENSGTIEATSAVALLGGSIVHNGLIQVGDAGVVTLVAATGDVTLLPNSMDPQMFVRIDAAGAAPASTVGIEMGADARIETGMGGRIRMGAADIYAVAIRNQAGSSLAASGGSVQLQGAAIEQFGSIATGDLAIGSFQDAAAGPGVASTLTVSGTINADTAAIDGEVVLAGATTFTGQTGQATSVSISGGVTGAGESLTLDAAAASVGGDMGVAGSEIGDLVASGDLALGGDVSAASVAIAGEASFTSDGVAQSMTSLGSIALGSAAKADGDLTLVAGDTLAAAGSIVATAGALSATATNGMTLGGDAIAGTALTLGASEITLDGAGLQTLRADAGDLTLDAAVTKATEGSLTISAGGSVVANAAVTVSNGSLTVASAGDLTVAHAMTASQDLSLLTSGGSIAVDAAVEATGGDLSIDAGGDLDLAATSSVTAGGDILLDSGASLTIGIALDAIGGSLSASAVNELTVSHALSARDDLTVTVSEGNLTIDAALTTTQGAITLDSSDGLTLTAANAAIDSGGDISLSAGGAITLNFDLDADNGSLSLVSKAPLEITHALSARDDLTLVSSLGGITVNETLTAGQDVSIESDGDLAVNAAIDAGRDITLDSGGMLGLGVALNATGGSITATAVDAIVVDQALTALENISLTSSEGGITVSDGDPDANLLLTAGESISLDAAGTLTLDDAIEATNGSVSLISTGDMAVNQSLTAGESITLSSGGSLSVAVALDAAGGSLNASSTGDLTLASSASAAEDLALASGGRIEVGGGLTASNGSVVANATDALELGGDATAGTSLTLSGSQVTLDGGGTQTLSAGSGGLSITGDLSKTLGDLVLSAGTTLASNGSITLTTGSLSATATDQMVFGGDLISAGNLSLSGSSVLLTGDAAQEFRSNTGAISIDGDLTKTSGDLTLAAATTLSASGSLASTAGSLTATSGGATTLGGDATAATDLSITASAIELTGTESQLLQAGSGDLTLAAAVTKAEGDLTLSAGGTLDAVGSIAVAMGSLTATSVGDLLVDGGTMTASENLSLTSSGGTLTIDSALEATNGAITLASGGDMAVNQSLTAGTDLSLDSGGTLAVAVALEAAAGSISATSAGDMTVTETMTASQNLTLSSGAALSASGDLAATGGSLSATSAGDMTLAAATASQDLTLTSGASLSAGGDLTATGGTLSATAEGDMTLAGATAGGDMTLASNAGGLAATGALSSGGSLSATAAGDMTLAAATASQNLTLSSGGSLSASGDLTATAGTLSATAEGDLSLGGATSGGDMTLASNAGVLAATGGLSSGGSLSATSGGDMALGGSVSAARSLTLDAGAGTIEVFSDLSAGMGQGDLLLLRSKAMLQGDSRWSGREIRAEGRIDGHHELAINAGSSATFLGNIGETAALEAFNAESGLIVFGDGSAPFLVRTDNFRLLQSSQAPGFAVDMVSGGDLRIETGLFDVTTGRKITVLGDFTIDAAGAGSVTIGDVNTGGVFTIDAAEIFLRLREPGTSIAAVGPLPDSGLDLIALGGFDFSVAPTTVGGGGIPLFSSPNAAGDLGGTLGGFIMLDSNQATTGLAIEQGGIGFSMADLFGNGSFYDLVAYNATNENVATLYAGASQEDLQISDEDSGTVLFTDEEQMLEQVFGSALEVRPPTAAELRQLLSGSAVLVDHEVGGPPVGVSSRRLGAGRARALLETATRLESGIAADPSTYRAAATELLAAYRAGQPLARTMAAAVAAGETGKAAAMRLIGEYLRQGESLGLSPAERRLVTAAAFPEGFWPQTAIPGLLGETRPTDPLASFDVPAAAFAPAFWAAAGDGSAP